MAFTEKNWKELEQNAELKAAMEEADSPEKIYEILKQHNVDVTLEEVQKMTEEVEELTEESLDNVAGGCSKCGRKVLVSRRLEFVPPLGWRVIRIYKYVY